MDTQALNESAKAYGFSVGEDGAIHNPSGKRLSTLVIQKGTRLQVVDAQGAKLATLKDEAALGPFFLAKFYYAEKV